VLEWLCNARDEDLEAVFEPLREELAPLIAHLRPRMPKEQLMHFAMLEDALIGYHLAEPVR
jgi:hypothetical protein